MHESGSHAAVQQSGTDTAQDQVSFQDALQFLRRAVGIVSLTTILAVAVGAFYLSTTPRSFVGIAQLLIEPRNLLPYVVQDRGVLDLTINSSQVESQIEVLRSSRIALAVIKTLELDDDPEFGGGDPNTSSFERTYAALGEFSRRVDVRRVGQSYVVQITSRSQDQDKAAAIANAVADAYLKDQLDWKVDAARRGREWLQARVDDVKQQFYAAARAVQEFRMGKATAAGDGSEIDAEVTLIGLESAMSTYRKIHEDMLQRLAEASQNESSPSPDARVIVAAVKPLTPAYPSKKLILAFSVLAGVLFGLCLAAIRSATDRSLRSQRQIRRYLDLPCLGILPRLRPRWRPSRRGPEVVQYPKSSFSRALRALKTSIELCRVTREVQLIGISPTVEDSGATMVASNLAVLFAASGIKTLLVTGDQQRSWGAEPTDRPAGAGATTRQELRRVGVEKFDLLQVVSLAQEMPSAGQGSPLLADQVLSLLRQFRMSFSMIIVDLPPLLGGPEALTFSRHLDAVVIVTQYGKTPLELAMRATGLLRDLGVEILGVVMNKAVGMPRLLSAGG